MKNIEISPIMKTNKILTFFTVVLMVFAITSCVQDDDFSVPNSLGDEENERLETLLNKIDAGEVELKTISEVRNLFLNGAAQQIISEIAVKGYVSSSDETGNFYKEFFIQDSPTNPTAALKVVINQVDTYNQFNKGREVYIYLKDLYIGETNASTSFSQINVVTIGGKYDDFDGDILEITQNQKGLHVLRSTVTEVIEPVELNLSEITEAHVGMFVKLLDVQFPSSLQGQPYVDPTDDYDSQRLIESCSEANSFIMESSSFANFSDETLPTDGRGTISGIINSTYDGYDLVINLNTTEDVVMDQYRCDPVFEENFNSSTDGAVLDTTGWINYAEAGTALWMEDVYSGNGYARFTAYNSGESLNIGWLISPAIDLDAQDGEVLTFETEHSYPDLGHDPLEVLISTDFDGTEAGIASATWQSLTFDVSYIVDYDSWFTFTSSGPIDLSGYSGTAYIAFKYTGSDTANQNMTLDVDNVSIEVQ